LFIPSPQLFTENKFGDHYWEWSIILGLFVTISGQAIRAATIGLAYIIRGGKDKKVYAEELVTTGIFSHCRNPLYVGNILMLLGVGIISNSLIYVLVIMPVFIFIYHAIVLAEENYLRNKFGESFNAYCKRVNRWVPSFSHIARTFKSMKFNWRRWILKEYNTQFVWLSGIALILLLHYPQLTNNNFHVRNAFSISIVAVLLLLYLIVRYLKKSGRFVE
jgi:protein-S-isoprenylcysteine O-methyltransferase Ste14